jgi:hypothetical protein
MPKLKRKKRNPNDATMRNIRALKKQFATLSKFVNRRMGEHDDQALDLHEKWKALEDRVEALELKAAIRTKK